VNNLNAGEVYALSTIDMTPAKYEQVRDEVVTELARGLDPATGRPRSGTPFPNPGIMAVETLKRHGLVTVKMRRGEHTFKVTDAGRTFIRVFMQETDPMRSNPER
jgi:hypothetical protein